MATFLSLLIYLTTIGLVALFVKLMVVLVPVTFLILLNFFG